MTLFSIGGILIDPLLPYASFACDLPRCKGACCISGDYGAPVTEDDILALEKNLPSIIERLPEKNIAALEKNGLFETQDGQHYLSLIEGRECVFARIDHNGIASCMVEDAYRNGTSDFMKPLSCHLFPIRVRKRFGLPYLAYVQIDECQSGRACGASQNLPLYRFLEPALRRAFGEAWTNEFLEFCEERRINTDLSTM